MFEIIKTYKQSIAAMHCKDGEKFEYWIGMFMTEETEVPEGYEYVDFLTSNLGVCWLHGKLEEMLCNEELCAEKLY
ncbi:MAG: hypothetical protein WBJ13_06595 [Sedimentibacter sp.]